MEIMYNLLPFIFIILSLAVIVVIIIRRFPAIASLDVDNIPEEKEARIKEQILGSRLKKNFVKWTSKISKFFKWANKGLVSRTEQFYNKLVDVKASYNEENVASEQDKGERVAKLFEELEELDEREDFEQCEAKLIEIIGLDSKNAKAFEKLGDIYYENKQYSEAKRTYEHALKLIGEDEAETRAEIYFDLASVSKNKNELDQALSYIKEALRDTPNNPRFLDTLMEISIMNKDKVLAKSTYDKLAKVNPENQKLEEWGKKIEEITN
jgi:tetratricopeptide (TPR) repeat protein